MVHDVSATPTETLLKYLRSFTGTVVVDFYQDDCGPCKLVAPVLDVLSTEFQDRFGVVFAKIDVAKQPGIAAAYGVRGLPTVLIIRNGKVEQVLAGRQSAAKYRKTIEGAL
jgi:thioredoxin 1